MTFRFGLVLESFSLDKTEVPFRHFTLSRLLRLGNTADIGWFPRFHEETLM
jgi:hypothetical protein